MKKKKPRETKMRIALAAEEETQIRKNSEAAKKGKCQKKKVGGKEGDRGKEQGGEGQRTFKPT